MFKHKYNNLRIYFESSTVISSLLWRLTNINTECTDFAALWFFFLCWQVLYTCRFNFPAGLNTCWQCHTDCQSYYKMFANHVITVVDRPAKSSDLNPTRNLGNIAKRKTTNTRRKKKVKAAIKAPWGLLTPHHGLPPCHTPLMQWFMLKERRVKKLTYFSGVGHLFYDPLHNIYCHIYKNFTL